MPSNVTRDHHSLRRNLQLNDNYLSNDGGDEGIKIDDDGIMTCTTSSVITTLGSTNFKMELNDTPDNYFDINLFTGSGKTTISTNDDGDGTDAELVFNIDGHITSTPGVNKRFRVSPTTKTASSTFDATLDLTETLNLGSGAGGSDVHYGIRYRQTQTNYAGWDSVYLMHLYGGDAARTFAVQADGKVGIGEPAPQDTLEVNGTILVKDKLKFTQDDGDEYIDSLNDGYLDIDATTAIRLKADTLIDSASKLYFNDEGGEYISGDGNSLTITAGVNLNIDASGHVEFDGCAVGFDQEEETFSHDPLKNTGGTHDTQVDFRIGNKIYLQMTASMDQINLIFPAVSGNFLLLARYDGDWSIGDWKVWESDLTAATTNDVTWPGGTQPDHTASGRDIYSFYWDADNQQAYGVASLAFAMP